MSTQLLIAVIGVLGAGAGYIIKALFERRSLRANAVSNEASATAVVVAAARELVDPLRAELALERREHAEGVEMERQRLASVRRELDEARAECHALRVELAQARDEIREIHAELNRVRSENLIYRRRITELESGAS